MPKRSSKQKDTQELARHVLDTVVPDAEPKPDRKDETFHIAASAVVPDPVPSVAKNPAAVELGKLGGVKGGPARAKKLSAAERTRIAKKAAAARWKKRKA